MKAASIFVLEAVSVFATGILACGCLVTNLASVPRLRGHRIYLAVLSLGLCIRACISAFFSNEDENTISDFCLNVLIGPSLANLSLLRLLLLINIVTASKLAFFLTSGVSFLLHIGLIPTLAMARFFLIDTITERPLVASIMCDGVEAFWDLGCCLLYFCLWIQIRLMYNKGSVSTKRPRRPKMASTATTAKWRLVSNDGHLLGCLSSVLARCLLMAHEGLVTSSETSKSTASTASVLIFGLCIPLIVVVDLRAKVFAVCNKKRPEVLTVYSTTASRLPPTSGITVLGSEACISPPRRGIQRSVTFSGRCALSSLMASTAASKTGSKVARTKTWCGPLDEAMLSLVGEKHLMMEASNY